MYYVLIFLTIISVILLCISDNNFLYNPVLKKLIKVNKKVINNYINFSNLYISIDGIRLRNFTRCYVGNRCFFFKSNVNGVIAVLPQNNDGNCSDSCIIIKGNCLSNHNIQCVFLGNNRQGTDLIKVINYTGINRLYRNKYTYSNLYDFKVTQVINLSTMHSPSFCLNIANINYNLSTMRNTREKCNNKVLNYKQFMIKNNSILFNTDIYNLFKVKKSIKNRIAIKNICGNNLLNNNGNCVELKVNNNCFDYSIFKSFSLRINNPYLSQILSRKLYDNMINEYLKSFDFQPFISHLFIYKKYDFNYKSTIEYLLKRHKYIDVFNYLFTQVLGISIYDKKIKFFKSRIYVGQFTFCVKCDNFTHTLIINNTLYGVKVLYNGIVYNNPSVIFLDNSHLIKIDKIN